MRKIGSFNGRLALATLTLLGVLLTSALAFGAQPERPAAPGSADATLDDGGTFVVAVRPAAWLRDADFSTLTSHDDEGTYDIDRNSQVWGTWFIGARSAAAYESRWEPSP